MNSYVHPYKKQNERGLPSLILQCVAQVKLPYRIAASFSVREMPIRMTISEPKHVKLPAVAERRIDY